MIRKLYRKKYSYDAENRQDAQDAGTVSCEKTGSGPEHIYDERHKNTINQSPDNRIKCYHWCTPIVLSQSRSVSLLIVRLILKYGVPSL